MNESNACPKCAKPKVQSTHGSITQWMSSCSCDLVDLATTPADIAATTTILCKVCGKRIDAGRAGSLTQWIFRSDKCECEVPQPTEINVTPGGPEVEEEPESGLDVSGIELDPSVFPTDRYQALREIGKGAAGQVFLCKDKLLKIKVAVKCLRHLSSEQLISFQQEARATSKLSHPSIVKVLNFGITDGGAPYMVMDYIDGISLEKVLERSGPLETADAMSIVSQTADALAYAHSKGVLHRDIKSSNILIDGNRAFLIDFGIAMVKQAHQEPTLVQGRTVVGTPAYMSPDQANGLAYDERSEIYSLGCVLFEALAGEPPFAGDTALEIIGKHATQAVPSIREINPGSDCTDEVESILARCLAKLPDNRFGAMSEIRDACGASGGPVPFDESIDFEGRESEELDASLFAGRNETTDRNLAIAGVAAVLCVLVASGWFMLSNLSHQTLEYPQSQPTPTNLDIGLAGPVSERADAVRTMIARGATRFDMAMLWPGCTERDLAVFDHTTTAKRVQLSDVSDSALKHFADSPLEDLVLSGCRVRTLEFVPGEKTLRSLDLSSTGVDDAALRRLSRFQRLSFINLENTAVTANGIIKALSNLPLVQLKVARCPKVFFDDIEKLRMAFPLARVGNRNSMIDDAELTSSRFRELRQAQKSFDSWKWWNDYSGSHPDPVKRLTVVSLCEMAKDALHMHKTKLARSCLDKALVSSKQSGLPANLRVVQEGFFNYYLYNDDVDSAIKFGLEALSFDQQYVGVLQLDLAYRVAECLISKERFEEALKPLEKTEQLRFNWVAKLVDEAKNDRTKERDLIRARTDLIYHQLRLAHCYHALQRGEDSLAKSTNALRALQEGVITNPLTVADVYLMKANGEWLCRKFQTALESNEFAVKVSANSKTTLGRDQHALALKQREAILKEQKESGGATK